MQAEFGVIGGTGLYDPKLLKNVQEVTMETHMANLRTL